MKTARCLDTLVVCPHCAGTVDVTVETHRARIETISLLWDAFCERGAQMELELEELRNELELGVLRRFRGTPPVAQFCEKALRNPSQAVATKDAPGREFRG